MQLSQQQLGGLFFLVLSAVYGYFVQDIQLFAGAEFEPFTPRTLPKILSFLGICFSLFIIFTGRRTGDTSAKLESRAQVVLLLIAMLVYGLFVDWLGFLLATIIFLGASFRIMGEKNKRRAWSVAIIFSVLFWALLTQLLDVYLEPGAIWRAFMV
ncbi:tripartite tricarboxylate transporter TctB family protein [Alginatibacterium sediminis]|uniref:Tripartite tricarboxylate transporter TctB family protein n=1 Tax=Alginatibacterium sediminis TaxID=2164068 RepID=A0A420ECZ2_9ALTE|nr:tripartite tricarboxylate transporter TctB family protein [Alginatibacterium sediminis]RKF18535.1 tripartite tricarboxylate transporter TctB family protein [Alginatibacterium sediminis]